MGKRIALAVLILGFWATASYAADRYWVGGAGDWNDTAHWSATSGGANGQSVPTASDNCFFDDNSGGTFTINTSVVADTDCLNFDASGITGGNAISFAPPPTNSDMRVHGNLVSSSHIVATDVHLTLVGSGTVSGSGADCSGGTNTTSLDIDAPGGTYTLASNFSRSTCTLKVVHTNGTFDYNGFNFTVDDFENGTGGSGDLYLRTGTFTTTAYFLGNGGSSTITVHEGTSLLVLQLGVAGSMTIGPHDEPLYDVHITTGSVAVGNINIVHTLTVDPDVALDMTTSQNFGVQSVVCNGTSGHPITITSSTAKSFTITNQPVCDWLVLDHSVCDGAVPCIAGANSVDNGNNVNWAFSAGPVPTFTPTLTPTPITFCCGFGPTATVGPGTPTPTPGCTPAQLGVTCTDNPNDGVQNPSDCDTLAQNFLCGAVVTNTNNTSNCVGGTPLPENGTCPLENTPTPTGTETPTETGTPTNTPTVTLTNTPTETGTPTNTSAATATPTLTPQASATTTCGPNGLNSITQTELYPSVTTAQVIGNKCGRRLITIEASGDGVQCGPINALNPQAAWMPLEAGAPFVIPKAHNGNFEANRDYGCTGDGSADVYVTEFGVFPPTLTPTP